MNTTLKGLVTSFIKSIDLYNFLLKNHHRRTTIAAYYLGLEMGLSEEDLSDLVIAASLHDVGAISVKERDELVKMDIINPHPHARLGSYMLDSFAPVRKISTIIFYHHWPYADDANWVEKKGPVPIQSYILHVADRIEILTKQSLPILEQKKRIMAIIKSYDVVLFHPKVIKALECVSANDHFWIDIDRLGMSSVLEMGISKRFDTVLTLEQIEDFSYSMSKIIDARSRYTTSHSFGVSAVSYKIAALLGYSDEKTRMVRVAGLLHDIGKIAVPTEILDKNGKLSESEYKTIKAHAYYTYVILSTIQGLEEISKWASNHHENHIGTGYPNHLKGEEICEEMDIIAYADVYTALSEDRPYRKGMSQEEIHILLEKEFKHKHGKKIYQLIVENMSEIDRLCKESIKEGHKRFHEFEEFANQLIDEVAS